MVQAPSKALTLAEFLELSETKPASEYIDGQVHQKPMPQGKHSRLQGDLVATSNSTVGNEKIACALGRRSPVPDIVVFVWARIPCDDNGDVANTFPFAPDWSIEMLSPDHSYIKVTKNLLHCLKHRSQMGWLINLEE